MNGSALAHATVAPGDLVQPDRITFDWEEGRATVYFDNTVSPALLEPVIEKLRNSQSACNVTPQYRSDGLVLLLDYSSDVLRVKDLRRHAERFLYRTLRPHNTYFAKVYVVLEVEPDDTCMSGLVQFDLEGCALPEDSDVLEHIRHMRIAYNPLIVNGGKDLYFSARPHNGNNTIDMDLLQRTITKIAEYAKITVLGEPEIIRNKISRPAF